MEFRACEGMYAMQYTVCQIKNFIPDLDKCSYCFILRFVCQVKEKKKKFPLGKCSHNAIPQLYSVVCIILVLHVSWLLSSHHVLLAAGVEGY